MTNQQSRSHLESVVAERAARDPQFRQALLGNPRQVLEQELGSPIPQSVEIRVLEETPSLFYLVLPASAQQPGSQLSQEDLATVSGGWSAWSDCGSCDCPQTSPVNC